MTTGRINQVSVVTTSQPPAKQAALRRDAPTKNRVRHRSAKPDPIDWIYVGRLMREQPARDRRSQPPCSPDCIPLVEAKPKA